MGNTEDLPVLRRSLRILAKQKLKEEREQQQQDAFLQSGASLSDKPDNSANSATETLTERETKSKEEVADTPTSKRNKKRDTASDRGTSSNKRKRTPSPGASSSPAKRSPVSETQGTPTEGASCSALSSVETPDNRPREGKKQSRRKQSKEEITRKGKGCEERDTVIVDNPRKSKSGKAQSVKHSTTEHSEPDTQSESLLGKRPKPKRRRSKGKSRTQTEEGQATIPKGAGRSGWNCFSLPSLVDFARLNMASPE